jgi:hypothetical protein
MDSMRTESKPIGSNEVGDLSVTRISGRYTEEELGGLVTMDDDIDTVEQVWWEIEFVRPDGAPATRRRFSPLSAPAYDATGLQWSVTLRRIQGDRGSDGVMH